MVQTRDSTLHATNTTASQVSLVAGLTYKTVHLCPHDWQNPTDWLEDISGSKWTFDWIGNYGFMGIGYYRARRATSSNISGKDQGSSEQFEESPPDEGEVVFLLLG